MQCTRRLQDSHQSDMEDGMLPSTSGRRVALPYSELYEALAHQMVTEQATLLLYTLLHGCRWAWLLLAPAASQEWTHALLARSCHVPGGAKVISSPDCYCKCGTSHLYCSHLI